MFVDNNLRERARKRRLALLAAAYEVTSTSSLSTSSSSRASRRWWVRPLFLHRDDSGAYKNVFLFMKTTDEEKFFNYSRMTPASFDCLLNKLKIRLLRQSLIREPICPEERLAITLRYLASGDSMASISYAYLVAPNTVSSIILDTCTALWDILAPEVLPVVADESSWRKLSDDFYMKWNFPNCVSAIDGKHVVMQAPNNCGSSFFNYKQAHSLVLMAGADAHYKYVFVDIGGAGRQSDSGIFAHSNFGKRLLDKQLNLPDPHPLPNGCIPMPFVFVADEAFPLRENIMRPYPGEKGRLPINKATFNFRLSRARRIIENVFGITAVRWRILRRPIIAQLPTIEAIIKAVVVLHNFSQEISNTVNKRYCPTNFIDVELPDGTIQEGNWRVEGMGNGLQPLGSVSSNRHSRSADDIRSTFATYFCNEGQISRQWDFI